MTTTSTRKITPFLTFEGEAEAAMNFYTSLFADSEITDVSRYGADEAGTEGTVKRATFSLDGEPFICIDSSVEHAWTFTPAVSLFVTCETDAEIDDLFSELSDGGEVFMPLDSYPFGEKFGWVADRFGVSWQLSLE